MSLVGFWELMRWVGLGGVFFLSMYRKFSLRNMILATVGVQFVWGLGALMVLPSTATGVGTLIGAAIVLVVLLKWGQ